MQKRNTQIVTSIVSLVGIVASLLGIPFGEGQIAEFADALIKILGLASVIISQIISWASEYRKGNVGAFGKMK